jgi:hypothetical protein
MANRLKEMGETASWHLMVGAALKGAREAGFAMKRQPGRGLSNTYEMTKGGKTQIASIRTTRDRAIAFPPLEGGAKWKTLSSADLVLVSAVDDRFDPQNVDVYLFPGDEVRKRFDASYAARIAKGHIVKDNWGMWITLDKGDDQVPSQVGHSLAIDYPRIARFTIDELEAELDLGVRKKTDAPAGDEDVSTPELVVEGPQVNTVAEVLTFAREKIASLTGMPVETIKLDLKMGV